MKIGKKLTISSISITLIAMVMLSIIISNIVSNYIQEDIKNDVIKENLTLTKWISYNKFSRYDKKSLSLNLKYYEKLVKKLPTISVVFKLDRKPKLLDTIPNKIKNRFTENEINYILNQKLNNVYTITIDKRSFLAYNSSVQEDITGNDYTLLVVTLLSNELVNQIIMQIVIVLIATIVIISILSIIVTNFNARMITNPIKKLVKSTEKIAIKNFDEKVKLQTGDEFEILASAINKMADSLKNQDIEQKKFYENISHEIKTPLTVISGYAEGIKTNIFEDSNKALDTIIDECNRLKKQLENVIFLSKLDTVNDFYNFQKVNLNELICNVLKKLDSVIIINEIDIIYEPKNDIIFRVDKEKIFRVLINTLSNCIKYTKDTIYINAEITKDWVRLEISDNGIGFSRALLENPFSCSIIGEKEGSGIGLSIIKKVIDGHNGRIILNNKKEGGAIYIMEFPL